MRSHWLRASLFLSAAAFVCVAAFARTAPPASTPAQQSSPVASAGDEETIIRQIVDRIMKPFLAQNQAPGAIVGVSFHGHEYFFPYGQATNGGAPFAPDTLVEIGSCTKVFTTTLFALEVNRNQIDPNASAQKYMPTGFTLRPGAQAITPLMLADFTSGLPDDPTNLPRNLKMRGIQHYTPRDFLTWASHFTPTSKLPAPYLYSNAGIGLLSYLMAAATGKTWEEQLSPDILLALNLGDTELRPSPEQMKRMAQGHRPNGSDAPAWPIFAWYAAGGLRSTARDMLRFGEANLGHAKVEGKPVSPELISAMLLAQKPIYTMPNGVNQQAMAWVNNLGNDNPNLKPVILKNGGTVGFGNVIALSPTKDAAVFIAVNKAGANPAGKGVEIVRHLP